MGLGALVVVVLGWFLVVVGAVVLLVLTPSPSITILPGLTFASNSILLIPSSTTWNLEIFQSYSPGSAVAGIVKLKMITGSSSFTGVGSPEESVEQ